MSKAMRLIILLEFYNSPLPTIILRKLYKMLDIILSIGLTLNSITHMTTSTTLRPKNTTIMPSSNLSITLNHTHMKDRSIMGTKL